LVEEEPRGSFGEGALRPVGGTCFVLYLDSEGGVRIRLAQVETDDDVRSKARGAALLRERANKLVGRISFPLVQARQDHCVGTESNRPGS
jgi:hypothetical protein